MRPEWRKKGRKKGFKYKLCRARKGQVVTTRYPQLQHATGTRELSPVVRTHGEAPSAFEPWYK